MNIVIIFKARPEKFRHLRKNVDEILYLNQYALFHSSRFSSYDCEDVCQQANIVRRNILAQSGIKPAILGKPFDQSPCPITCITELFLMI